MVRYQNLTRKPELLRGPGTMYPLNPPLAGLPRKCSLYGVDTFHVRVRKKFARTV